MTTSIEISESVRHYYGQVLQSSNDLKTSACCSIDAMPGYLKALLAGLHPEVLERFYGCGSPLPPALEGKTVLDLGCGTGRDCYLLSKLVGPTGRVIGVDMTPEQLEVAVRHRDWHAERFGYANVEFLHGHIENLAAVGIADNSIDVVVSNCVINLSPEKPRVLAEIFRVLKPGGELYFSDVFADRRIPAELRQDPVLLGECLGGALYWEDFRRILQDLGCPDVRIVKQNADQPRRSGGVRQNRHGQVPIGHGARLQNAAGRPLRGFRPSRRLSGHYRSTSAQFRSGRSSSFRNRPTVTGLRQHRRHAGRQPLWRSLSGVGR